MQYGNTSRGVQQERRNNTLDNTTGTNNERQAQERGRSRINQMKNLKGEVPPNVNIAQLSHLICFYTNADNLLNKRSEFEVALGLHKPDVVYITEIAPKHCLAKVQQSELQVDGYDLCSNVHINKRGVVYIHSKILRSIAMRLLK